MCTLVLVKSRFGIKGFSTSDAIWGLGFPNRVKLETTKGLPLSSSHITVQ